MVKKHKGQSHQTRPIVRRSPDWCKYQPEEVEALVLKLSKEGNKSSKIGIILRDQYGIPLAKPITGKNITNILIENGVKSQIPEDLQNLLDKASSLRIHMDKHSSDKHNKRSLFITESNIRSLSRYYKRKGNLSSDWKYEI